MPLPRRSRSLGAGVRLAACLALCSMLSGCLVAGYSSGSGVWVWPGSIVITIVLILFYLLTRRR